jgi:hypothetical protein
VAGGCCANPKLANPSITTTIPARFMLSPRLLDIPNRRIFLYPSYSFDG